MLSQVEANIELRENITVMCYRLVILNIIMSNNMSFRALYGAAKNRLVEDYFVDTLRDDWDHSCLTSHSFEAAAEEEKTFVYDVVSSMYEEMGDEDSNSVNCSGIRA